MVLGQLTVKFRFMWKWLIVFTLVDVILAYFHFLTQVELQNHLRGDAAIAFFLILMWAIVRGRMKYNAWKYT